MELTDFWQEFGLDELDEKLAGLFPRMELDLEKLLDKLLQGDFWGVMGEVLDTGVLTFAGGFGSLRALFVSLIILGIVSAALVHFSDLFDKYQVGELGFYLVYLLQAALLIRSFAKMSEVAVKALENIVLFVKLLMPAYLVTVGIATGSVTAGLGYQVVLFLIYGVEEILKGGFLPMVTGLMLLAVLEGLQDRLELLINLIEKALNWGLRGAMGVILGLNFLQSLLAGALDSIKGTTFQKILSAIPGIGNGAESVIQVTVGTAIVIKNSVGILLLLFLILLCAAPLAELFATAASLKMAAAVMGLVSDRRLTRAVDRAGQAGFLILKITGTAMLIFLIAIAMTAATVRR